MIDRQARRGGTISRPTKATVGGRAFLALRSQAKVAGRTTAEYLRLYALEGFLLRLAHSPHRSKFVLKGGVLLAAYELRRPTADVDLAAVQTSNDVESVRQLVAEVAATALPAELDDGLTFDLDDIRAETIREDDEYSGIRVRLVAGLATAQEPFHVDVNVGDPIWPAPAEISLPRLLKQEPIRLRGYPMEMVLAEKIVTALHRGQASTRWRDFGDIYQLTGRHAFRVREIRRALWAVADYRHVELSGLDDALEDYAEIGQARWALWRSKLQLTEILPGNFGDALDSLRAFANPILTGSVADSATWDPDQRAWSDAR
jgi:predicted nucleotidyltransferase component of viral defense system